MLARHGGDEFAVLLPGISVPEAAVIADLLRVSTPGPATVSAGVAPFEPGDSASSLFHKADVAVFDAKSSGRDQTVVYGDPRRSGRELERAIANDEMRLYLQPVVDLQTGAYAAFESLVRWHHPRKGLVLPTHFIPQAERSGAIHALGLWVLREAVKLIAAAPEPKPHIGVNVSVVQLRDERFVRSVREILQAYDVKPRDLCLEVTESVLDDDGGVVARSLADLQEMGILLAVDDFGSGYSSLSRLARVRADVLKLDGSLVGLIKEGCYEEPLLAAIATLARSLGVKRLVAERIETEHQAEVLRRLGYDVGQGFLFARPAPAAEVLATRYDASQLCRLRDLPESTGDLPARTGVVGSGTPA